MTKKLKQVISNPFNLYYSFDTDTSEQRKENQRATREFKKCWKNFVAEWEKLQNKYKDLGASDTAAREDQIEWLKKHSGDIF
jgi:hypothetical protein